MNALQNHIDTAVAAAKSMTAWRIEGTLREFPKFEPVNLWFKYPVHRIDESDSLKDIQPDTDKPAWQKAMEKRKPKEQKKEERMKSLETAVEATNFGNPPALKELAQYMGISERSLRDRIKEHGGFYIQDGEVRKKT